MAYEYGFIGAGNMGSALSAGVAKSVPGSSIAVCNRTPAKAEALAEKIGAVATGAEDIAANSTYVVLAVKPQVLKDALAPLQELLKANPKAVLVTMAAGTTMKTVETYAGAEFPVIRIMPNTPASVGAGTTLVAHNERVTEAQFQKFLTDFAGTGTVVPMTEQEIDAAAVISGCGPAFVYQFMDAMARAGEKLGMDYETAVKLAMSTTRGSALLAENSEESLETLRIRVCSPGGTTIEGVNSLIESDLDGIVAKALKASYDRTLELLKG